MKTWLISLVLTLTSCMALSPETLPTDGPLGRQIQRVLSRHDSYVLGDLALADAAQEVALAQSAALDAIAGLPEVSRTALQVALEPVADRHDGYVRADSALDDLERQTYLGSTDSLRRLVALAKP